MCRAPPPRVRAVRPGLEDNAAVPAPADPDSAVDLDRFHRARAQGAEARDGATDAPALRCSPRTSRAAERQVPDAEPGSNDDVSE